MMKNFVSTLFLLFISINVFSQLWSPEGAKWHFTHYKYFTGLIPTTGYVSMSYENDTTINGEASKMLLQTLNEDIPYDTLYTKEVDSVVFIYNTQSGVFDTLFNFASEIGGSWSVPGNGHEACGNNAIVEVENKGHRFINGFNLMWLKIKVKTPSETWYSDTIYQRFGTIGTYFMPYSHCEDNLEMSNISRFRCYEDDNFTNLNTQSRSCDYIPENSTNELASKLCTYKLYRKEDVLRIITEQEGDSTIDLIVNSLNGFQCFSFTNFNPKMDFIDLQSLPSGIYIININKSVNIKFKK